MSRTGIITTYLSVRLVVGSGFHNTYLIFPEESTKDNFQIADKSKIECNNCPVPHKFFRNWAVPDPTSLLIH